MLIYLYKFDKFLLLIIKEWLFILSISFNYFFSFESDSF